MVLGDTGLARAADPGPPAYDKVVGLGGHSVGDRAVAFVGLEPGNNNTTFNLAYKYIKWDGRGWGGGLDPTPPSPALLEGPGLGEGASACLVVFPAVEGHAVFKQIPRCIPRGGINEVLGEAGCKDASEWAGWAWVDLSICRFAC